MPFRAPYYIIRYAKKIIIFLIASTEKGVFRLCGADKELFEKSSLDPQKLFYSLAAKAEGCNRCVAPLAIKLIP